jgi:hypothetical protein
VDTIQRKFHNNYNRPLSTAVREIFLRLFTLIRGLSDYNIGKSESGTLPSLCMPYYARVQSRDASVMWRGSFCIIFLISGYIQNTSVRLKPYFVRTACYPYYEYLESYRFLFLQQYLNINDYNATCSRLTEFMIFQKFIYFINIPFRNMKQLLLPTQLLLGWATMLCHVSRLPFFFSQSYVPIRNITAPVRRYNYSHAYLL